MKRLLASLFFVFSLFNISYADALSTMPDDVIVRQHWVSLTKSYDIQTDTEKLGTLYRRFFSFLLTYDFYDTSNVKTITAKARFFSFGVTLDLRDENDRFIGEVEEKIFTLFPTFDILGRNFTTRVARAEMNFWGTKFRMYDPETGDEMLVMSRHFFRLKDDWTVHVTNRELLDSKNIDPRVLLTVLAVQSEIEDWRRRRDDDYKASAALVAQAPLLSDDNVQVPESNHKALEALADELDQGFKAAYPEVLAENNDEKGNAFITYCSTIADRPGQSQTKQKAIRTLLRLREAERREAEENKQSK